MTKDANVFTWRHEMNSDLEAAYQMHQAGRFADTAAYSLRNRL